MASQSGILIIDDDFDSRDIVRRHLQNEGFTVYEAEDGREGLRHIHQHIPDLILLDIGMPEMDGFTFCQRVREISTVPIIMLTARSDPEEIVKGLEMGADDYIVKPFDKNVLLARVRANLRRVLFQAPSGASPHVTYSDSHLRINVEERRVVVSGQSVHLSPIEFGLLETLIRETPRVVPYRSLLEAVWGFEYIDDVDYLRVYIWHLRRKIEPDPKHPTYIQNEPGVGYRFQRHT